jgi:AbrB family looped-hinge helix DNA binding protein
MSDNTKEYKAGDIFQDIEDDPDNVNMVLPQEVREKMGWQPGDVLKVQVGDQGTLIITKVDKDSQKT